MNFKPGIGADGSPRLYDGQSDKYRDAEPMDLLVATMIEIRDELTLIRKFLQRPRAKARVDG